MSKPQVHWALAALAVLLLTALASPASALTKEEKHDEMVAIAAQISAIKANPASAAQVQQLQARYAQLSASLGGDDPGALAQPRPAAPSADGGLASPPPGCANTITTEMATDTPLAINDNATTTSTLTVAGAPTYVLDVQIETDITHTFASDLEIDITSPAGTVVTLTTDNGGGNDDVYAGTVWDDDAGDLNAPGPVTDNTFANLTVETPLAPEEALAAFIGEDPNGTWQIDIFDDAGGDTGTLNDWGIRIESTSTMVISDPVVSVTSSDTPLAINDNATTTSMLTVSGANAYVCDVDVTTDITHTFASDLEVDVTSPGGTVATLTTDNGGGSDDVFAGTLFDDDGGDTNPPGPATDNTYANLTVETPLVAEEANGAFIGEDPNGTWQIDVFDDAGGDTGTLNSWTVDVTTCSCVLPDADLEVSKSGVANGDQIVWTVTVTNNGPDDATGVLVTDPLNICTSYVSDDCGGMNTPPWTWNVGALANGASAVCNITVDASACPVGDVTNDVSVVGNENDPVAGNNAAAAAVGVGSILEIPTLGDFGLVLLAAILALGAMLLIRRRTA